MALEIVQVKWDSPQPFRALSVHQVSITVRNLGSTADIYLKLQIVWAPVVQTPQQRITAGESATFTARLSAPGVDGTYALNAETRIDGQMFGPETLDSVQVSETVPIDHPPGLGPGYTGDVSGDGSGSTSGILGNFGDWAVLAGIAAALAALLWFGKSRED